MFAKRLGSLVDSYLFALKTDELKYGKAFHR